MDITVPQARAAWRVADLQEDRSWIFSLDDAERAHLAGIARAAYVEGKPLFDYTREDFDLGSAGIKLAMAMKEAYHGRGMALVRGLPRADLTEHEFRLLNWGIGLNTGVARPQGKATQYISDVRDVGTDYRSASGRGFSSNAKLDFHADGADLVTLGCFNAAKSGGQSMISSSVTAREILMQERPDLADIAHCDFYFSRQNEQTEDEGAYYGQPLFDTENGLVFAKWNRNRVQSAQRIEGVPPLSEKQRETTDVLDEILQRPDVMYTMWLEPGDLQILNNHVMLHSRTNYEDHDEPEKKRLLCRLWLATPDSVRLPQSWWDFYRSVEPGTVRGGIRGHNHGPECLAFERRQAESVGMKMPVAN
ncbi:MAG: TauD/TfdA family dioxygenase [Alphaproteobacteria bacterium]|nr:TauD/TfdA family dioxygenase [Alphaproteobacteria bacterium]